MTGFVNSAAGMDRYFSKTKQWLPDGQYYIATSNMGGIGNRFYNWDVLNIPKGLYVVDYFGSVSSKDDGWFSIENDGPMFNYSYISAISGSFTGSICHGFRSAAWGGLRWSQLLEVTSNKASIRINQAMGAPTINIERKYNCSIVITRLSR